MGSDDRSDTKTAVINNDITQINEQQYIFLCHNSNIDGPNNLYKTYKVDSKSLRISGKLLYIYNNNSSNVPLKVIVETGDDEALIFVVKYLNKYKDKDEIAAPEHPLLENVNLDELFEYENDTFGQFLQLDNIEKNIIPIKNVIRIAEELQIKTLVDKLSAILCYYLQSL